MQERRKSAVRSDYSDAAKTDGSFHGSVRGRAHGGNERSAITKITPYAGNQGDHSHSPPNNMASRLENATTEIVAHALRELAFSSGDQEGISEFLTDYFASDVHEFSSGK